MVDGGVHDTDDKYDPESPDQAEFQTDVAVEIQRFIGIVPPSGMEEDVQQPAGQKLDGGGKENAHGKQRPEGEGFDAAAGDTVSCSEDGEGAKSVDGAYRSV